MHFYELETQDRRDRMVAVLRQLTAEAGYSHKTLAKVLNVSKAQVGLTLLGERRIEFVRIFDWLTALDVTPHEFLERLNTQPPVE